MVNKAAVGIVAVVFVLLVVVSLLLGLQFAGGSGGTAETTTASGGGNGGNGGGGAATTTTANATANVTANVTTGSTPTLTGGVTTLTTTAANTTTTPKRIPPSEFNATKIEILLREDINQARQSRGLEPLSTSGTTVERLNAMASFHSDNMARIDEVTHLIDGNQSGHRYRKFDLYYLCQWQPEGKTGVYSPSNPNQNQFESIAQVVAGRPYERLGSELFLKNESQVADAISDYWFSYVPYKDRLTYPGATKLGVGVNVTDTGEVYATANVC